MPLHQVLSDVEALVDPLVRAKHLTCEFHQCDPHLIARADPERLRQIIVNLISNALKFTDLGGSISVECLASKHVVAVNVRDDGRGIPADKLGVIFDPFVQLDNTLTRTAGGTGLGLAISRDLARGMGGDVTVVSALGQGSTFTVTLPRGKREAEVVKRDDSKAVRRENSRPVESPSP